MTRVAIAGLGAIGRVLARKLSPTAFRASRSPAPPRATAPRRRPGSTPSASSARWSSSRNFPPMPISRSNARPPRVLERICRPMLEAGKRVMVLSAGALLPRPDLIELAKAHGGQIIVPTGALLGLDAVDGRRRRPNPFRAHDHPQAAGRARRRALSRGERHFGRGAQRAQAGVRRHRPRGGGRLPGQCQRGGGALARRHRARPHQIEIWADPTIDRNCHTIEVESDSARFTLSIENIPSENPKTGRITALSVLAALRKLHAPLRVGT